MEEAMFEHLFQKYKDMIYRVAFLYLKNEADALDIVQNTFIKLLKKNDFNDEEHLKRWLLRVCINLCKNNLKSYWKRNVSVFEEEFYQLENSDLKLQELVFKLAPNYYEGYSVKEISVILKISEAAVKQRLKRARTKLKIELEAES